MTFFKILNFFLKILNFFFKDNIVEANEKLQALDDEIWGKIIIMERNQRVGKAYLRNPIISVNGSEEEFNGYTVGWKMFNNPHRDPRVQEDLAKIGAVKIPKIFKTFILLSFFEFF